MLNSDGNKMPMEESVKVKEKVLKQFDKEGIGFKSSSYEFHKVLSLKLDVAWRLRLHLIKNRAKHKVIQS